MNTHMHTHRERERERERERVNVCVRVRVRACVCVETQPRPAASPPFPTSARRGPHPRGQQHGVHRKAPGANAGSCIPAAKHDAVGDEVVVALLKVRQRCVLHLKKVVDGATDVLRRLADGVPHLVDILTERLCQLQGEGAPVMSAAAKAPSHKQRRWHFAQALANWHCSRRTPWTGASCSCRG